MISASRVSAAVVLVLLACAAIPASAQSVVGKGKTGPVPDPVVLNNEGSFQAKFVSVGDDMFIAGQPTEKALRDLRAKGVTTIVNLRMPEEMARVGFDEAAIGRLLDSENISVVVSQTGYLSDQPSMSALERYLASGCCFVEKATLPLVGRTSSDEVDLKIYVRRPH